MAYGQLSPQSMAFSTTLTRQTRAQRATPRQKASLWRRIQTKLSKSDETCYREKFGVQFGGRSAFTCRTGGSAWFSSCGPRACARRVARQPAAGSHSRVLRDPCLAGICFCPQNRQDSMAPLGCTKGTRAASHTPAGLQSCRTMENEWVESRGAKTTAPTKDGRSNLKSPAAGFPMFLKEVFEMQIGWGSDPACKIDRSTWVPSCKSRACARRVARHAVAGL